MIAGGFAVHIWFKVVPWHLWSRIDIGVFQNHVASLLRHPVRAEDPNARSTAMMRRRMVPSAPNDVKVWTGRGDSEGSTRRGDCQSTTPGTFYRKVNDVSRPCHRFSES